jgi:phosphoglycerol transferase MdoB-like AlkP superfamily enzyme
MTSYVAAFLLGMFGAATLLWFQDVYKEGWRTTGATIHILFLIILTVWLQRQGWLQND